MGVILKHVFELVELKTGFKGRVKLSSMIGIPSDHALATPDDPGIIAKAKRAATEILGEDADILLEKEKL